MNALDILVLTIPVVLVGLAFYRGFMMEVVLFVAWAGAVEIARLTFPETRPFTAGLFSNPTLADLAAFGVVAIPIVLLARVGFEAVSKEINTSHLGLMNRGMGAALGLVRGVMLAWLFVGLASWSFFRSAPQMLDGRANISVASGFSETLPVHDILCSRDDAVSPTLIRRLQRPRVTLSAMAEELVAFHDAPDRFPMVRLTQNFSTVFCGKEA